MATDNIVHMRVNSELVKEAKVAFVKSFDKDYDTNNNLATEIFQWFIDSQKNVVADSKKKRSA